MSFVGVILLFYGIYRFIRWMWSNPKENAKYALKYIAVFTYVIFVFSVPFGLMASNEKLSHFQEIMLYAGGCTLVAIGYGYYKISNRIKGMEESIEKLGVVSVHLYAKMDELTR